MSRPTVRSDADVDAVVAQTVAGLAQPGSFFTGAERIALARSARAAIGRADEGEPIPEPFRSAAAAVMVEPWSIRRNAVDRWAMSDLDRPSYVELVAVVGRLAAVDTYRYALGQSPQDLPTRPSEQPPSCDSDPRADVADGWVPTVGPITVASALSALPREASVVSEIVEVFHLDDHPDLLMALVAARTAYLNNCPVVTCEQAFALRSGAEADAITVDLGAVRDSFTDAGLDGGTEALALVDAIVLRDDDELDQARTRLVGRLGMPTMRRVARTTAAFEMITRIASATGVPLREAHLAVAADLALQPAS